MKGLLRALSITACCLICSTLPARYAMAVDAAQTGAALSTVESAPGKAGRGGLTQGSLTAVSLPEVTVYGLADQAPVVPVSTRFGTQFNVVTEEQIRRQGSLDFYDALRNVPGVMYQKKNIIGGQTGHSLYIRGRGASHPSPDLNILFDDVPRSGVLYGQALADGIPVYALGGMEVYKYPQPSRFGSGYGLVNFIPKYMAEEGEELRFGFEAGRFGTYAQNAGAGVKRGPWDIYAAQSFISTDGHVPHSAANQQSYYTNLGYEVYENWSVRFMGNYVKAKTEGPRNPLTDARNTDRFNTETGLATLTLANDYEKAGGYLKLYYNNTNFYMLEENGDPGNKSKQSNDLWGLRGRETFRIWEGGEFVAGFDLDRTSLTNDNWKEASDTHTRWNFPGQTLFSPYLAFSQYFGEEGGFHLIPSGGLRYYSHNLFNNKAAPQAGLVFGYGHTDINFNYAKGVNYPSPVVFQGMLANRSMPSGFDMGKINPEVVDHFEAGLSHSFEGIASLNATLFHDRGTNRLRAFMWGMQNPNEAYFSVSSRYKIRGMELSGNVTPVQGLDLFAAATWLKVKATGEDGEQRDKMPYTPSFSLQAGIRWNFYDAFTASCDYQLLHGLYAGTSARPQADFAKLTQDDKLRDIGVLNARLEYAFDYEPLHIRESKVFVSVDNILDKKYAYTMEKDTGGNRAFYYMPGISYMAGFEVKF